MPNSDTLELPEAARRLVDGGHVDVRAERVRLSAEVLRVVEQSAGRRRVGAWAYRVCDPVAVLVADELVDHQGLVQVRPAPGSLEKSQVVLTGASSRCRIKLSMKERPMM